MRSRYLLALLVPLSLEAQATRDSVITVSASRTTRVVPDRASFYVVVEGNGETATDATAKVETKLKPVIDALKALGAKVETDRPIAYSVGPTINPNGYPGVATPPSNTARSLIRVQVTRADQMATVAAVALAAGASGMTGPTFEATAADSIRRARIAEALAAARADAQVIAASLDGRLGALVDASTTTAGNFAFPNVAQLNFDARFMQSATAPEVVVTTSVTVRFRLIR
jgi:uncharacterized protein YggE